LSKRSNNECLCVGFPVIVLIERHDNELAVVEASLTEVECIALIVNERTVQCRLIGTTSYFGSGSAGHHIALVRGLSNQQLWYVYDDTSPHVVTFDSFKAACVGASIDRCVELLLYEVSE
jgi:hypothetical protein